MLGGGNDIVLCSGHTRFVEATMMWATMIGIVVAEREYIVDIHPFASNSICDTH